MSGIIKNISNVNDVTNSNTHPSGTSRKKTWKEKSRSVLKSVKNIFREMTVEPCLFTYMLCTAISSLAVQHMHLEKACRINFNLSDEICDRIRDRNTTGLEDNLIQISSLVANVVAWKFPLQNAIPAVMVIFVGAWSDKYKKRKICILFPFIGEIIANIGLLLATYYFKELPLRETVLIEALPAALTGSYVIIFTGMYSYMVDRTSVKDMTFRLGIVTICVTLGTPIGTALSGVLLRAVGYYGVFGLQLGLYTVSLIYGIFKLEDVLPTDEEKTECNVTNKCSGISQVFQLVANTVQVAFKPRSFNGRTQILCVLALYLLMVGPLNGDSQVSYLYSIRKVNFTEAEYSVYSTINIVLGLFGTFFCISILSKRFNVQDSAIGGLAGVSRIAGCCAIAFAPTRIWFYVASVLNTFSHTGLTAVRSIACKCVSSEEVAKLNALIGVTEAISPSIYLPASSYIYMATVETFPGAFYMFDAGLSVFALGLFTLIYVLVKRRNGATAQNPNRREEFARPNELIHLQSMRDDNEEDDVNPSAEEDLLDIAVTVSPKKSENDLLSVIKTSLVPDYDCESTLCKDDEKNTTVLTPVIHQNILRLDFLDFIFIKVILVVQRFKIFLISLCSNYSNSDTNCSEKPVKRAYKSLKMEIKPIQETAKRMPNLQVDV